MSTITQRDFIFLKLIHDRVDMEGRVLIGYIPAWKVSWLVELLDATPAPSLGDSIRIETNKLGADYYTWDNYATAFQWVEETLQNNVDDPRRWVLEHMDIAIDETCPEGKVDDVIHYLYNYYEGPEWTDKLKKLFDAITTVEYLTGDDVRAGLLLTSAQARALNEDGAATNVKYSIKIRGAEWSYEV